MARYNKNTFEELCERACKKALREAKELFLSKGQMVRPADYMPPLSSSWSSWERKEAESIMDDWCDIYWEDFNEWIAEEVEKKERAQKKKEREEQHQREEERRREDEEEERYAEEWEREHKANNRLHKQMLAQKERDWKMAHKQDCIVEQIDINTICITILGIHFDMKLVEGGVLEKYSLLSDYFIGATTVTQELWMRLMEDDPSDENDNLNKPVTNIDRTAVDIFLKRLNKYTGAKFELPTDNQWKWAYRGGQKSNGYKYAGSDRLPEVAWREKNSGGYIHPVSLLEPNELRLYDMEGNVCELVLGEKKDVTNYSFNPTRTNLCIIGRSAYDDHEDLGWNLRNWGEYEYEFCKTGLRLVLNISVSEEIKALMSEKIKHLSEHNQ